MMPRIVARRPLAFIVWAAVVLASSSMAYCANYQFIKIADTSSGVGLVADQAPQINDSGSVMFQSRQATDAIYLSLGGTLTNVYTIAPATSGTFDLTGLRQLNNNDQIVFDGVRDSALQVFYWSGGTLSSLYDTRGPSKASLLSVTGAPTLDNHGTVYFAGSGYQQNGIFVGNTTVPTLAVNASTFSVIDRPVVNDSGTVAYYGRVNGGSQGIYTTTGGVTHTIASAPAIGSSRAFYPQAINSHGAVAYIQQSSSTLFSIVVGDGTNSATIVDSTGAFAGGFGPVAINNAGEVAFSVAPRDSFGAIYTGTDPIADRVIGVGDLLFGGRIIALGLGSAGLNNHGDVAFSASLVNPVSGTSIGNAIFVAHAVPEPGSMLLAAIGGFCATLAGLTHRRSSDE